MPADKKRPADKSRMAACRVLHAVLEEGAYANLSSIGMLSQPDLDALDRRFASAMIYGTLSRVYSIDWLLGKASHKPLTKLDPWVRTILRMAVWQMIWARTVSIPAAIDESVHLANWLTNPGAAGYVNATLRHLSRGSLELPAGQAVTYGLSPEIYGYFRKWYGPEEAQLLAESFLNEDICVTARVNTLRNSADHLGSELMNEGMAVSSGRYCPEALRLDLSGRPVRGLRAWQRGDLMIQDEAAMLVGHAASPKQGQLIIDLCAAPGGKTSHLAELTADKARILAFDINPERLELVRESAERLALTSIECRSGDATGAGMDPSLIDSADLVLADVPCSGLGLLARKPEIRLTMSHLKMLELYPLQEEILKYAASLVRSGGILIYSTCTINPAENIERIQTFLAENADRFALDSLTPHLPASILAHEDLAATAAVGWIQLLPHRHFVDGFFIARLRRL